MKALQVSLTCGGQSLLNYAFLQLDGQILIHTPWDFLMIDKFESTKSNLDAYGKNIF